MSSETDYHYSGEEEAAGQAQYEAEAAAMAQAQYDQWKGEEAEAMAAYGAAAEYDAAMQQELEAAQSKTAELILSTDCTKDAIIMQAKYIKDKVLSGEVNALQAGVHISAVEKVIAEVKEAIRGEVIREVEKHGKTALVYGTEVTVREAGVKYNYDNCGDDVYKELCKQMETLKEKIKQREKFLQCIVGTQTLVDEETGAVNTVHAPIKTSTTTYAVSHK